MTWPPVEAVPMVLVEPFASFAVMKRGVPLLCTSSRGNTGYVEWNLGSLWWGDHPEFEMATWRSRMGEELVAFWGANLDRRGPEARFGGKSTIGYMCHIPLDLVEEAADVVRDHFSRALEVVRLRVAMAEGVLQCPGPALWRGARRAIARRRPSKTSAGCCLIGF